MDSGVHRRDGKEPFYETVLIGYQNKGMLQRAQQLTPLFILLPPGQKDPLFSIKQSENRVPYQ